MIPTLHFFSNFICNNIHKGTRKKSLIKIIIQKNNHAQDNIMHEIILHKKCQFSLYSFEHVQKCLILKKKNAVETMINGNK